MPFCSNPGCPHFKETGRAAEYSVGIKTCSDCGSELTDEEIVPEPKKRQPRSEFHKRLIYTVVMLALFRALSYVVPPGINLEAISDLFKQRGGGFFLPDIFAASSRITVLALGLMPYITASVIVEILALFLKPLKQWRQTGPQGRIRLRQAALIATLILALIQGYTVAQSLAAFGMGNIVYDRGISYRLLFALTLTAGTFILIGIAHQITRKGIGHGVSVLLFASFASVVPRDLSVLLNENIRLELPASPFQYILTAAVISTALILLIIFMEKGKKKIGVRYSDGTESYIGLKLTTAGIIPADFAGYVLFLPVVIASFINTPSFQSIMRFLSPGSVIYSLIYATAIFVFYYFFTSLYYRPKDMIGSLQDKGAVLMMSNNKNSEDYLDHILELMAFAGAFYLCILFFLPEILIRVGGFPINIGGVSLIISVAVVLDLMEEIRFRKKTGKLAKITEFHDLQKADLFRGILENKGIPTLLQGYYHRSLLYFFGPYIEISAFVPSDRAAESTELFEKYIA